MLMLLKKQNLTNPDVSVQYHVALSDKVKCVVLPTRVRGKGAYVLFSLSLESYSMCFPFVQITGSKAANSVYYMLKLPSLCFYVPGVTPLKTDIMNQYSCDSFYDFAVTLKFMVITLFITINGKILHIQEN